jgi:transposase
MNRKRKPYKTYPKEIKLEAVRLMRESDQPASEIATALGIRRTPAACFSGAGWKEGRGSRGDPLLYQLKPTIEHPEVV